jgi:hypothetical protein
MMPPDLATSRENSGPTNGHFRTERVGAALVSSPWQEKLTPPSINFVKTARAKRAAKAAIDPREKVRLVRIAKKDQAKAIDIENDLSRAIPLSDPWQDHSTSVGRRRRSEFI